MTCTCNGEADAYTFAATMIPQSFIQDLLARVDIVDVVGRYVQLKKGGPELSRPVPVPWRKIAVVHRQSDQAVLSLLWLRRARQRDRLPDGAARIRLRRGDQRTGAAGRHAGSGEPRSGCRRQRQGRRAIGTDESRARIFTAPSSRTVAAAIEYLKRSRPHRPDRRALRHRIRAGCLAAVACCIRALRRRRARRSGSGHRRRRQAL